MLDVKNVVTSKLNTSLGKYERLCRMKGMMDTKAAAYLRYLGTKNQINRASDYHYLMLAVTQSTAPVNGIDYIHPVVKPCVDYATAVISKGLTPNGEVNFEFIPDHNGDADAARQATDMVTKIWNQYNAPHKILQQWAMDAVMHKNGMLMVQPVREKIDRYVETQGTADQLRAFEQQAAESGLTVLRQSRRKVSVNMQAVMAEAQSFAQSLPQEQAQAELDARIAALDMGEVEDLESVAPSIELEQAEDVMADAIARNTVYAAKYKLTGYSLNIQFKSIPQHYWICDPTVVNIKDQPFCGYYDDMSIQEVQEMYPDVDLEEFRQYASYNQNGAYQAGSTLNNLAIHARDSVPIMGIPVDSSSAVDPDSRRITVLTIWNRFDIDGDGEMELVEIIFSGDYIISAREVEFIPVANMCPKPLPGNFYGMSIAESVIPAQEYATAGHRAEIQLGLLTATPRLGVKPDKVDFEMLMDGEAAIFVLDTKFDPATDVYPLPPPSGNLQFIDVAMDRIQQDTMALIGMTTPQDVFNPEVMGPGNSGAKLQLALGPNQIIQDNTVKNAADGLRDAIWLTWRTLIQYGDDYGVKKLAAEFHPDGKPEFIDYKSWDDMDFHDRKLIHMELALGMMSEENQVARIEMIKKAQMELYGTVNQMAMSGALTPEIYAKIKRPYEDTLYVLGVKDIDTYLPTDDEVVKIIQQSQAAAQSKEPSPVDKKDLSVAELNAAKTQQIQAEIQGTDADSQLNFMSMAGAKESGKPQDYGH
jgi:hypothetical protein